MGIFSVIVQTLVGSMLGARHSLPLRYRIGAELVGNHAPGPIALLTEKALQQSLCGRGIAANLNDLVENAAVLVKAPPEITLLAVDRDDDLVEMPHVAPAGLLALQAAGVIGSEFHGPAADGFVGENDPAFEQHLLSQA